MRHTGFIYGVLVMSLALLSDVESVSALSPRVSLVLTAKENGLEPQYEFVCSDKIHGYLVLPERAVGKHLLEGIWMGPGGHLRQHSRIPLDFPPEGRSTAYLWFKFPDRPAPWRLDPVADRERLSYNGKWKLDVRWDGKPLILSTFTVRCQ